MRKQSNPALRQAQDTAVTNTSPQEAEAISRAAYLYCVAEGGEGVALGRIGLEGSGVYTIPYGSLCAVVHDSEAKPYHSIDAAVVLAWVTAHQRVVEAAWKRWGTIIPMSFDTMIRGDAEQSPQERVRVWLQEEHQNLQEKMARLRGRAEYGIQIFWDSLVVAQEIIQSEPEIRNLQAEIEVKPKGLAYLYRQRLDKLLRGEMEAQAQRCFTEFFGRIRKHVEEVRVEKTKSAPSPTQMLMNLSCLVSGDGHEALEVELGQIAQMEGFSVRFTGPWPPYSFVGRG